MNRLLVVSILKSSEPMIVPFTPKFPPARVRPKPLAISRLPVIVPPSLDRFPEALPSKSAVIVPAEKLPSLSLITTFLRTRLFSGLAASKSALLLVYVEPLFVDVIVTLPAFQRTLALTLTEFTSLTRNSKLPDC